MSYSTAARRARLISDRDIMLFGGGGQVWALGGTIPATPETAAPSTPLVVIPLDLSSFTLHAAAASMAFTALGNAAHSGTVTWLRFADSGGTGVLDLTAGPPGSGAQVVVTDGAVIPTSQVWVGGEFSIAYTFSY